MPAMSITSRFLPSGFSPVSANSACAVAAHTVEACVLAACALAYFAVPLSAQPSNVTRLAAPSAILGEEFSRIASVRELPDGRVLISDEKDTRVVVADFTNGSVRQIGRTGSGPGEYRQVGRIWALAGDTTLIKEPFAPRWILLSGSDAVSTLGAGDNTVQRVGQNRIVGSDAIGNVVWTTYGRDVNIRPSLTDSLVVLRLNRASGRVDTIARAQLSLLTTVDCSLNVFPPQTYRIACMT